MNRRMMWKNDTSSPPEIGASAAFRMPTQANKHVRPRSAAAKKNPTRTTELHSSSHTYESPRGNSRENETDQRLLEMLTSTISCLKHKKMDMEALGCLEQSLWLKRRMFGVESSAVRQALKTVVLSYNSTAMNFLSKGDFDQCLVMLRKAESITAPGNFVHCESLQILTFNNIGCCYRKLGRLRSALKYLKEAARIGSICTNVNNLSVTHLNLCAIHSQIGRHDLALEHAQAAIFHTQQEMVNLDTCQTPRAGEVAGDGSDDAQRLNDDVLTSQSKEEKVIALAVAYHNLAVELEFNQRGHASLQWYKKALQLVWKYRESNRSLYDSFKKIFQDAKKKHDPDMKTKSTSTKGLRPKSAHSQSHSSVTEQRGDRGDDKYSLYPHSQGQALPVSHSGCRNAGFPARTRQRPVSARPQAHQDAPVPSRVESNPRIRPRTARIPSYHEQKETLNNVTRRPKSAHLSSAKSRYKSKTPSPVKVAPKVRDELDDAIEAALVGTYENKLERKNFRVSELLSTSPIHEEQKRKPHLPDRYLVPETTLKAQEPIVETEKPEQPSVPGERVGHVEFLKKMRELAETIRNDLAASIARSPHSKSDTYLSTSEFNLADENKDAYASKTSTPRSSKIRDRIDEAREASLATPLDAESSCGKNPSSFLIDDSNQDDGSKTCVDKKSINDEEMVYIHDPLETTQDMHNIIEQHIEDIDNQDLSEAAQDSLDNSEQNAKEIIDTAESFGIVPNELAILEHDVEDQIDIVEQSETLPNENESLDESSEITISMHSAATKIQSVVRGFLVRCRELQRKQRRDRSAVIIQAQARKRFAQREFEFEMQRKMELLDLQRSEVEDMAVRIVQQCWHTYKSRLQANAKADKLYTADESSYSEDFDETEQHDALTDLPHLDVHVAAAKVQATMKGFTARHRASVYHAKHISRMYLERQHLNVLLERSETNELYFLENLSAVKIQAVVRGRQSRLLSEMDQIVEMTAASRIQQAFREKYYVQKEITELGVQSIAAQLLQNVYRKYVERRVKREEEALMNEVLEVEKVAAICIQRFWRHYFAARDHELELIEAATCIQALGRGHIVRKSRQSLHNSASTLSSKSSAFLNSPSKADWYGDGTSPSQCRDIPSSMGTNIAFLPPLSRKLYLESKQKHDEGFECSECYELDDDIADLILRLEVSMDASEAIAVVDTMREALLHCPEKWVTLPNAIQIATAIEVQLRKGEFWKAEFEEKCGKLLHEFDQVLQHN